MTALKIVGFLVVIIGAVIFFVFDFAALTFYCRMSNQI